MPVSAFRVVSAGAVLLTSALAVSAVAAAQTVKGDLWETTTQMVMDGMPIALPSNTMNVCGKKDASSPPVAKERGRNCTDSNRHVEGNKVTWDVACTGPTMTGKGEMLIESPDKYSGTLKFASADGNITIKLTGKKIGECDNPQ